MYFLSFPEVHIFFSPATQTRLGEESLLVASWWFFHHPSEKICASQIVSISTRFWGKNNKYINILKPQPKLLLLFLWPDANDMFFFSAETVSAFSDALCITSTIFSRAKILRKKTHKIFLPCLEMGKKNHVSVASSHIFTSPDVPPRSVALCFFPRYAFHRGRHTAITQFDQGSSLFHGPVEHLEKVQREKVHRTHFLDPPPTQDHDIF